MTVCLFTLISLQVSVNDPVIPEFKANHINNYWKPHRGSTVLGSFDDYPANSPVNTLLLYANGDTYGASVRYVLSNHFQKKQQQHVELHCVLCWVECYVNWVLVTAVVITFDLFIYDCSVSNEQSVSQPNSLKIIDTRLLTGTGLPCVFRTLHVHISLSHSHFLLHTDNMKVAYPGFPDGELPHIRTVNSYDNGPTFFSFDVYLDSAASTVYFIVMDETNPAKSLAIGPNVWILENGQIVARVSGGMVLINAPRYVDMSVHMWWMFVCVVCVCIYLCLSTASSYELGTA